MELPEDVLQIIRDYSMPITRPDWRTLHIMPYNKYLKDYSIAYKQRELDKQIFYKYHRHLGFCHIHYNRNNIFNESNYWRIIYLQN
jgi:hypothetical protein